jgi:flagellar basal-body rod modification protein FlgD
MTPAVVNSATGLPQRAASDRGMNALSSEDFFRLLVTELQQQDPLAPAKTGDMINQVAQIRSIEQSKTLNDTLQAMQANAQQAGVSVLIGKFVVAHAKDADGVEQQLSGVVTGVRFDVDGSAWLDLDNGTTVAVSDVKRIMSTEAAELAQLTTPKAAPAAAPTTDAAAPATSPAATAKTAAPGMVPPAYDLFPWIDLKGTITL